MTVLCADRDSVDIHVKEVGKRFLDSTCKGYSKGALLQPMRPVRANSSNHIQSPAEIPNDLITQLCVEPLACGICP
jgi:hypothetical protein